MAGVGGAGAGTCDIGGAHWAPGAHGSGAIDRDEPEAPAGASAAADKLLVLRLWVFCKRALALFAKCVEAWLESNTRLPSSMVLSHLTDWSS